MIRYRLKHMLRGVLASFWFWPVALIAFAVYLAASTPDLVRALPPGNLGGLQDLAVSAGQVYAVTILTTAAGADITILTFVFSTLMVVLQLASSQLSPRVIRPTLREGRVQVTMAIMAGGFVFSLCSLLGVYAGQQPLVVGFLVLVSVAWTILIVLAFLYFVGYTVARIRAPAVIRAIAGETARGITRTYEWREPTTYGTVPEFGTTIDLISPKDGVLTGIGTRDLVRWAQRWNVAVDLDVGLGDYVSAGVPIGRVSANNEHLVAGSAMQFVVIERERTLVGDPPYGFRLLIDIASRSLSPAINDPTTAVQVIDELQSLLVMLAQRPEDPGHVYDDAGVLRLTVPSMSWNAYLRLAVQEIYEFGRESSQITQRIARMLEELVRVAPEPRAEVARQLLAKIAVVPPII